MKYLAFVLFLTVSFSSYSQELDSIAIKELVQEINNTQGLDSTYHNWSELTGIHTDGGAELISWRNKGELVKVYQQVGLSFGRLTTIIYLHDDKPIMAIETEENFELDDQGEIDYRVLKVVFQEINYYYKEVPAASGEYDLDYWQVGKRVLSEQYCSSSEFLYPVKLVKRN
jgi:hypothetical protein